MALKKDTMWWVPCSLWYKVGEYLDWSGAQGVRVTVISKALCLASH